jgi:hypothetical protein
MRRLILGLILVIVLASCSKKHSNEPDSLESPSNLILTQLDSDRIALEWQDNCNCEEGFRIDRKIGDGVWEENYRILDENTTTCIDSQLVTIDEYSYRIYAFEDNEYSTYVEESIDFFYDDVETISLFIDTVYLSWGDSVDITISLYDSTGNLVQRDYDVWCRFMSTLEGTNLNNTLFGTGDSLHVLAVDGTTTVTLHAGTEPGPLAIKVYTYNAEHEEISGIRSNIVIHSSMPETIYITCGGIDSGLELGNGEWQIDLSAVISDACGNPVSYGMPVSFSIEDPENPGTAPNWASIEPAAYVGNQNAAGDSIPGVAFTTLIYDGCYSNRELLVWAEVGGMAPLTASDTIILPIQFAGLSVSINPNQNLSFTPSGPNSIAVTFNVSLYDGQGSPINDQQLLFFGNLGTPVDMGTDNDNDPFTENTGVSPNLAGQVSKELIFHKYEVPPPNGGIPGSANVTLTTMVVGTDVSEEIDFVLLYNP